ncbi:MULTISPECIES: restriction endonuclease subunit S [unclassified Microbacterium]|uniref:restriction endonuclease subunit S n=1 Tax=unclassified Microbacterium TaxID=2609290 RepID=UPI000C5072D4|nr:MULTISPECIES: restriction endonuclease subunit S [unclassified Microbacterium]MBU21325.1 hypothetical protein [Microbacterium sp.]HBU42848.1 hypothetical protein [Microbacterium sp.]
MIAEVPLKWVVSYNDDSLPESTDESTQIRYVEISDVNETDGITGAADVAFGEAPSRARRILQRGDVIVSTVRTYLRAVAAVGTNYDGAICSTGFAVLRARGVDERFLKYAVLDRAFMDQVVAQSTGVSYPAINASDLVRIRIPLPAPHDQRAIADYLDRETAQIDAFIAKNEELITLLTERRGAVIELAIREGAGATAKLGVLLRGLKDGTHGSFARIESPHPLLGARNVQGGRLVLDGKESTISEDDHRAIVANGFPRRGDVLLVIVGATIGKSAVYELTDSLSFQRSVAFLRPGRLLTSRFLWYYTQTRAFQDEVWLRAKVSAQPGLYLGDVASIPIALPDVAAQQVITTRLDRDVVAIDEAISVATTTIELARERRAALISAAVTGKIEVGVAV